MSFLPYVLQTPSSTRSAVRLFQAASKVSSSYDALLELFECLETFLKRLEIYVEIPPTEAMTNVIVKIMVELLAVLALARKEVKQGRASKCPITHLSTTHSSIFHSKFLEKATIKGQQG